MNKDNNMRNFSLALYEGTIDKLLKLKEKNNWTHDEMQNKLIDFYERHDKKSKE